METPEIIIITFLAAALILGDAIELVFMVIKSRREKRARAERLKNFYSKELLQRAADKMAYQHLAGIKPMPIFKSKDEPENVIRFRPHWGMKLIHDPGIVAIDCKA